MGRTYQLSPFLLLVKFLELLLDLFGNSILFCRVELFHLCPNLLQAFGHGLPRFRCGVSGYYVSCWQQEQVGWCWTIPPTPAYHTPHEAKRDAREET